MSDHFCFSADPSLGTMSFSRGCWDCGGKGEGREVGGMEKGGMMEGERNGKKRGGKERGRESE